jgi:flagellar biosynthesis anti-sigma factor FlgM
MGRGDEAMGIGRIDGKGPPLPGVRPAAAGNGPVAPQARPEVTVQEDTVSVSFGSLVQRLVAGAMESQAVDPARLEALRQAIADGSYTIDPEQIAQRLMDMERGLRHGLPWT